MNRDGTKLAIALAVAFILGGLGVTIYWPIHGTFLFSIGVVLAIALVLESSSARLASFWKSSIGSRRFILALGIALMIGGAGAMGYAHLSVAGSQYQERPHLWHEGFRRDAQFAPRQIFTFGVVSLTVGAFVVVLSWPPRQSSPSEQPQRTDAA